MMSPGCLVQTLNPGQSVRGTDLILDPQHQRCNALVRRQEIRAVNLSSDFLDIERVLESLQAQLLTQRVVI
ncbi:hypothetical protein DPEC_G00049190 [Dallia pectoralis]|uniref:Uncharacterized protein n=1 Tax=Dallia pectoralis TaxID=75939 RepID=A0ACC2HBD3_DALPE|nr:hypothetical protein DPEC_G00049190 [Dallia pectoralis]